MILRSRSNLPLRSLFAAAAAVLIPVLAGCEAGPGAPTQRWHQPTPGASVIVNNSIRINNMFVLGPAPGSSLGPGASAGVFLAVANSGSAPDRVLSMSAPGSAKSVTLPGGGIPVAPKSQVLLTGPAPQVVLDNLTRSLSGGQFVHIVLNFANAGRVVLPVPIMPRAQYYSTFSPVPVAAPSLSASPVVTITPITSATPSPTSTQPTPVPAPTPTPSPSQ